MSSYSPSEAPAGFAVRRTSWLRRIFVNAFGQVAAARERRRQRRELIDYLTGDHRVYGDLGVTGHKARGLWRSRNGECLFWLR